ncbi:hypothetical protein VTN49DRAFT_4006 [Thermomyces lanuginosus]|uniref:uncharacterized protein n=1 Tax=Thermomyces lanuginosus TaxID=5541 RepID=UPI00374480B4
MHSKVHNNDRTTVHSSLDYSTPESWTNYCGPPDLSWLLVKLTRFYRVGVETPNKEAKIRESRVALTIAAFPESRKVSQYCFQGVSCVKEEPVLLY